MEKLRLDLDALEVDTFDTARAEGEGGTVLARDSASEYTTCMTIGMWCTAPISCIETNCGCPTEHGQWTCETDAFCCG